MEKRGEGASALSGNLTCQASIPWCSVYASLEYHMLAQYRLFSVALGLFAIGLLQACGDQVVVRETEASCGNGEIEAGEACDDGNAVNTDGCTDACAVAICGDGTTRTDLTADQEGYEACDDGNQADDDSCLTSCALAVCGENCTHGYEGGKA